MQNLLIRFFSQNDLKYVDKNLGYPWGTQKDRVSILQLKQWDPDRLTLLSTEEPTIVNRGCLCNFLLKKKLKTLHFLEQF